MFSWISKLFKKKYVRYTYRKVEEKYYGLCGRGYVYKTVDYKVGTFEELVAVLTDAAMLEEEGFKRISVEIVYK